LKLALKPSSGDQLLVPVDVIVLQIFSQEERYPGKKRNSLKQAEDGIDNVEHEVLESPFASQLLPYQNI
jgi:hypothetical protein